jgi:hypothetical protein
MNTRMGRSGAPCRRDANRFPCGLKNAARCLWAVSLTRMRTYRTTAPGGEALAEAKERLRELFPELIEDKPT